MQNKRAYLLFDPTKVIGLEIKAVGQFGNVKDRIWNCIFGALVNLQKTRKKYNMHSGVTQWQT